MTHLDKANLAREAAMSAYDAHEQIGHMPPAKVAVDFMIEVIYNDDYDDVETDRLATAWETVRSDPYFAIVYNRTLKNMRAKPITTC